MIDERVHILRGLATEAHERHRTRMAVSWERRMAEYREQAALIRQVLMARKTGDTPDGNA